MKRFLMLVGVAVVAGAMYVAASPASQQAKAPTAKQFTALKKQVATLSKTLKAVKTEANAAVGIIGACYLTVSGNTASFTVLPVSQFGTTSSGFVFGAPDNSTTKTARSALDIVPTGTTPQAYLQEVSPTCVTSGALTHGSLQSRLNRLHLWAEHTR
jgi:outer membrane murein-binding lipoprotein Lpp